MVTTLIVGLLHVSTQKIVALLFLHLGTSVWYIALQSRQNSSYLLHAQSVLLTNRKESQVLP